MEAACDLPARQQYALLNFVTTCTKLLKLKHFDVIFGINRFKKEDTTIWAVHVKTAYVPASVNWYKNPWVEEDEVY